jgi:hypothetical protein
MEAEWIADRTTLRALLGRHPTWTLQDFADALGRSLGWVKKWVRRLRGAPSEDDTVLHSRSRARQHPPPRLSPVVIERLLEIRDQPPEHLRRTPGPRAILDYLARDPLLQDLGERLPRSTRTVWRLLREHGRIPSPAERHHELVERPVPLSAWQIDFKDVATVPPDPEGKQEHVVETLNTVDCGTSVLLAAQVRDDFTAETALVALAETLERYGVPATVTMDRDPLFVGSPGQRDFPSPLQRLLLCLGVQVLVCPPTETR